MKGLTTFKVTIQVDSKLTAYVVGNMKVISESYKGIEFVRISSLDAHEKSLIWQTLGRGKVIKILRDNELLNDCIQYHDYMAWRKQMIEPASSPALQPRLKKSELQEQSL
ncbi:MAG: hypothetical protein DI538_14155 [Azospira oryzae]|nr:MAG: hypothetical protein DI538_14155 [Azospira oryzae]